MFEEQPRGDSRSRRFCGIRTTALLAFALACAPLASQALSFEQRGEWVEVPVQVTPPLTVSLISSCLLFVAGMFLIGLFAWVFFTLQKPKDEKRVGE